MHANCRSLFWAVFFVSLAFAASSCALLDVGIRPTDLVDLPDHIEIADVPFFPQESHQCGPAALAAVLTWSGSRVVPNEIAAEIYTPGRKGSLQPLLISATRHHDRLSYVVSDVASLLQEVSAGHPIVVLQNLGLRWYPRWHYAVVIGYNVEKRLVILRSGTIFRRKMDWSLFRRTWERAGKWGLVVLPPTELPASASEQSYLETVVDLEKVHKWETASIAYKTALQQWPRSVGALMGLGNSRYAVGDLREAEEAFRRATEVCTTCGDAFNNLAHVLAEQKCYERAIDSVREAIRIGGPNKAVYLETLEEIKRLRNSLLRPSILPSRGCLAARGRPGSKKSKGSSGIGIGAHFGDPRRG